MSPEGPRPPSGRHSSFDGPGARPILDPPPRLGTSTSPTTAQPFPGPQAEHHRHHHHHHSHHRHHYSHHSSYQSQPPVSGPGPSTASSSSSAHTAPPFVGRSSVSPKSDTSVSPQGAAQGDVPAIRRVGGKANVSSACGPCKKAHLACDPARPCKRCVNMGKEDMCEDVPHKKRGRPKMTKPPVSEPYRRARPSTGDSSFSGGGGGGGGGVGRWRGPPGSDSYLASDPAMAPAPAPYYRPPSPPRPEAKHELFELFTTIDLKILRATPACYNLTGYHPHEYVNISLLEWVHPADRHVLDSERLKLISVPYAPAPLSSDRETQAALTQLSERELLSPAEGMREPYPNQNVRVLRSDNSFDFYNVRLHLGGGLGASLWRAETLGRAYLVISLLHLRHPPEYTAERMPPASTLPPTTIPPTPITSLPAPVAPPPLSQPPPPAPVVQPPSSQQQSLPSFSSFAAAAAAEAPSPYYPPPPPTAQSLSSASAASAVIRQHPTLTPQQAPAYMYGRPSSASFAPPTLRTPPVYPDYSPQPPPVVQAGSAGSYFPDLSREGYRRPPPLTQQDDDAARRQQHSSGGAGGGDYSRRAWEL